MSLTPSQKTGGLLAAAAYTSWGILPIYLKHLDFIPSLEILMHRVVWSCVLLAVILFAWRQGHHVRHVLSDPHQRNALMLTAALLAANWAIYIWAINNHHMIDASLGYYITPLLNIVLGMVILHERLRPLQRWAVLVACVGVGMRVWSVGTLPWIALALATSFAFYGLIRKKMKIHGMAGLFVESLFLLPVSLGYWMFYANSNATNMLHNTWTTNVALMAAGLVTTVPLLCFNGAAQRIQLSTMGFFQYIGPTLTLILGVFLYGETVDTGLVITLTLIWAAVLLYLYDVYASNKRVAA